MKDIHSNPLFTDITAEEEVSVQGGGWIQNFIIGQALSRINPVLGAGFSLYNSAKTLYDYHKRTDPYRDSKGRLIAS